jgi:hypothetical protein
MRSTRGIALAALPLQLFVLLFAWHKHTYYYVHEVALYGAAAAAGVLTLGVRHIPRLRWRAARIAAWLGVAVLLAFGWWQLHKWHGAGNALTLSAEGRLHEAEIARASNREILGAHARVASRIGAWYSSGGEFWHNSSEIYQRPFTRPEADAYFARFDAIAENAHMSDATYNPQHKSVLSWYLEGALQVRGFFFAHENSELSCLLLQTPRSASPEGFALKGTELYRFAADDHGTYEFDVVTAPVGPAAEDLLEGVENRHTLYLPQANPAEPQQALVMTLSPAAKAPSARRLLAGSRVVQRIRGSLLPVDKHQLVDKLRRTDQPMRFFANLRDVPPPRVAATSAGLAVR